MNKVLAAKQAQRRDVLDILYQQLEVGVERGNMSAEHVGKGLGITQAVAGDRIREISGAGIIARRWEMRPRTIANKSEGRIWFWTLLIDKQSALDRLAFMDTEEERSQTENRSKAIKQAYGQKNGKSTVKTEVVAIRKDNGIEVEAIVGPDAPGSFESLRTLRKDESYALVEAARQYAERDTKIGSGIDALVKQAQALGVTIDLDALRGSITVEQDDRLETVGLVLPYIERLEREVSNLTARIGMMQETLRENETLRISARRLKEQNDRLIAEKVARSA